MLALQLLRLNVFQKRLVPVRWAEGTALRYVRDALHGNFSNELTARTGRSAFTCSGSQDLQRQVNTLDECRTAALLDRISVDLEKSGVRFGVWASMHPFLRSRRISCVADVSEVSHDNCVFTTGTVLPVFFFVGVRGLRQRIHTSLFS